jgi:[ribosomal protein S18]-alanine N-acetyltransferase
MPRCSIKADTSVQVRRASRNDIRAMETLKLESPASSNWSNEHYESLFRTTAPESSRYFVLVAEDSYQSGSAVVPAPISPIVAYLVAHCIDRDWELQYIVVAKRFRRRGLATLLLNELVEHARSRNAEAIFLEVREANQSARALYRKAGFGETGLRRSYYSNPVEDAILCRLRLY